jgi:hypothetical protein
MRGTLTGANLYSSDSVVTASGTVTGYDKQCDVEWIKKGSTTDSDLINIVKYGDQITNGVWHMGYYLQSCGTRT